TTIIRWTEDPGMRRCWRWQALSVDPGRHTRFSAGSAEAPDVVLVALLAQAGQRTTADCQKCSPLLPSCLRPTVIKVGNVTCSTPFTYLVFIASLSFPTSASYFRNMASRSPADGKDRAKRLSAVTSQA